MHLCVDDMNSKDPVKRALVYNCRVLLDGVEQASCLEADEEEGFVRCYDLDENGHVKQFGGEPVIVRREGVVKIEDIRKSKPASNVELPDV